MKPNLNCNEQREFERQAAGGDPDIPQEVLKMFRLRKLISKAWLPMGIGRDEGADILLWAVGEDVARLNFTLWPDRIRENTGINFTQDDKVIEIMRKVALKWQSFKIKPFCPGGIIHV